MSPYGNFRDPGQEQYLFIERELARAEEQYYNKWATQQRAAELAATSLTYPGASTPTNLALVQGGIPAGSPAADQLVYTEEANRLIHGPIETPGEGWSNPLWEAFDTAVVSPLKGTTRWTFAAWQGAYDLLTGGAIPRTLQMAANEGISVSEAWGVQDPYFFEALGGVLNNERVNLGSGFFPQSDVAPSVEQGVIERMQEVERQTEGLPANERYEARLTAAPGVWRQSITENAEAQAELGKPITELSRADYESVMFTMPNGNRTPWSPGRIAASMMVEPGTEPYHKISGTLDVGAQAFLDPVEWVGIGLFRHSRHARKIWGEVRSLLGPDDTMPLNPGVVYGPHQRAALPANAGAPSEVVRSGVQIGDPQPALAAGKAAPAISPSATPAEVAREVPWWVSGQDATKASVVDPPTWFIDEHMKTRRGATFDHGGTEPVWNRLEAGIYEADLPRLPGQRKRKLVIQRKGKGRNQYWEIVRGDNTRVGRMDDVEETLEPVAEGYTRLWRGERKQDAWDADTGSWYSESRWNAEWYAQPGPDDLPNRVLYVDVPTDDLGKYASGRRYEYNLPPEARAGAAEAPGRTKVGDHFTGEPELGLELQPAYRKFDPRYDTPQTQFKTLREAQEVAHAEVARYIDDDLKVYGMTADEFMETGEDFFLRVDVNGDGPFDEWRYYNSRATGGRDKPEDWAAPETWRGSSRRAGRDEIVPGPEYDRVQGPVRDVAPDITHRDGSVGGKVSGIKMRVWGKTLDLSDDSVIEDLPVRLQRALRADKKLDTDGLKGFGSNQNLDKWNDTVVWAKNNGYGKIKWNDDDYILIDHFKGGYGDPLDPIKHVWYDSPDVPMGGRVYDTAPTAGEVDDFLSNVGDAMDDMAEAYARGDILDFDWEAYRNFRRTQMEGASTGVPKSVADEAAERGRQMELYLNEVADDFAKLPDEMRYEIVDNKFGSVDEYLEEVRRVESSKPPPDYTFGPEDAPRPDWNPRYKLRGKRARLFLERLTAASRRGGQKSRAQLDQLLKGIESRNIKVPNEVRRKLFEAKSPEEVEGIFVKWLTSDGPHEILLPGGVRYGAFRAFANADTGRLPRPAWIDRPGVQRRIAMAMPHQEFNILEDPAEAYARFQDALPHYNIGRDEAIELLDEAGDPTGVTTTIESVLDRLVQLDPGSTDKDEAWNIMQEFSEILFSKMAANDSVDPRLAKQVSRWWREAKGEAIYDAERFGKTSISDGVNEMTIVEDALVGGLGPQMTSQLWTGALGNIPDPRTLKRVANYSDALGRIANGIALKKVPLSEGSSLIKLEERTLLRYYDSLITKVWKPFVLLRGAWTLRILMDDQFRMAAEGYSMFNHPIRILNYALTQSEDWRTAFTKGWVDINGVRISAKNVDEIEHAKYLSSALMSRPDDPVLGSGAYGRIQYDTAGRGSKGYVDGLAYELELMQSSPVMKALAGSTSEDPIGATVKWLLGQGPKRTVGGGEKEMRNIIAMFSRQPEIQKALRAGDEDVLRAVVERMHASLHRKTGGIVHFADGEGRLFNYAGVYVGEDDAAELGMRFIVESEGDSFLLDGIAHNRTRTAETRARLNRNLSTKVKASTDPERFPDRVIVPKPLEESGVNASDMDKAVRGFYNFFMTKPSDALSRVPEFRRAYWEKMADLYPYMDKRMQAEILAKMPASESTRALRKATKTAGVEGQIVYSKQAMSHVDELAKAHGLTMVERTLFDLANKRNISDSLRLVFPFIEAWGEFITRWGRLMVYGDRNVMNARRLQQFVEGFRENDPFASDPLDSSIEKGYRPGFFYENQFGQEVFNYPAWTTNAQIGLHNTLNNLPVVGDALGGDISPEVAGAVETTGSVESLNFAAGVIPGFGPVFQIGAKKFIPEDPKWDWVRDIIAPFGVEGGAFGSVAPAWVKRIMAAQGGMGDPQLEYTWTSTVIDVLRTMIDRGDFAGVTSQAEVAELLEQAEEEAQGLLMVRAAATYVNPTSPSYKFTKEDRNGMVWSYSNLGRAYYDIREEIGDDTAAFDEFYRRFGFLPTAFSKGKTYSVLDRSLTEEGSRFERGQPELFTQYPNTAMYLDPTIDGDSSYDHEAMLRLLRQGLRERWTPEQFVYLQQDQLGEMWWDNINERAFLIEDRDTRDAYLASERTKIEAAYPYWRKPVPGKVQSVTNDEQMAEVQRWLTDPTLAGQPVVEAAREYEYYRQEVLVQIEAAGATTIDGPKSRTSDAGKIATLGREWLRNQAEDIALRVPQFEPLFQSVYRSEVETYNDSQEPKQVALGAFEGQDILEMVYG